VALDPTYKMAECSKDETNAVWKNTGDLNQVVDFACLDAMNNYKEIVFIISKINIRSKKNANIKSKENASIGYKENVNWKKACNYLVTYEDEDRLVIKNLRLMNNQFRFFYLVCVHELLTLSAEKMTLENHKELIIKFHQVLKDLGDFENYTRLFINDDVSMQQVNLLLTGGATLPLHPPPF
jgi:hypothetical protein